MLAVFIAGSLFAANHSCRLGLSLNVSIHGGAQEFIASIQEEQKLGCTVMQNSVKWSDLEPSPGQYKLDKLKADLDSQKQLGFVSYLTLQCIDTMKRMVPPDLAATAWDAPEMLAREKSLLKAICGVMPDTCQAVMLGNEVDGYLGSRATEADQYVAFLREGRSVLHTAHPGLLVGVTTMFIGIADHGKLIDRLHRDMDFVSMTYYPTVGAFGVLPTEDVGSHFAKMLAIAGSRKLYIQEAGYPASELLGSSEAKQAAFVDALFDAMDRHDRQLLGVCYFLLVDFNDDLVKTFVGYYKLPDERFKAFLSTLGLKKQDGTPRLAWSEFKKRALAR